MSRSQKSTSSIWQQISWIVAGVVVLGAGLYIWVVAYSINFVPRTINYVVYELSSRSGISSFFIRGVVILLTIPFFIAVLKFTRSAFGLLAMQMSLVNLYKNGWGIAIIVYVGIFYLAMGASSMDSYAYKNCARTPEGLVASDNTGKEPIYGVTLHPCSADEIKELRTRRGDLRPVEPVEIADPYTAPWFNPIDGRPLVWYVRNSNGTFRYFDGQGRDPLTGAPLMPVTLEIVREAQGRLDREREQSASRAAAAAAQAQATAESEAAAVRTKARNEQLLQITAEASSALATGNFEQALKDCDEVLRAMPRDDRCKSIYREAAPKEARVLVRQSQLEVQQNRLDEALQDAERATKLDPENESAKKIKMMAQMLKHTGAASYQ